MLQVTVTSGYCTVWLFLLRSLAAKGCSHLTHASTQTLTYREEKARRLGITAAAALSSESSRWSRFVGGRRLSTPKCPEKSTFFTSMTFITQTIMRTVVIVRHLFLPE